MKPILEPGKSCWCRETAERVAFLVDGQAIFAAFEAVALQAKKSLLIVGWDIDTRVVMKRSQKRQSSDATLGAFLESLAEARKELAIHLLVEEGREHADGSWKIKLAVTALIALVLTGVWLATPLRDYLDAARIAAWAEAVRQRPFAWFYLLLAYLVAGLVFIPVTVQIVATTALFAPVQAFFYCLGGCFASALLTYWLGWWLGRNAIQGLSGGRLKAVSEQAARDGMAAVALLRLIPVAPFTLINLVAGASHIRLRDYLLGTLLGMLPGIAILTLLTDRVKAALTEPGPWNAALLVVLLAATGLLGYRLKKRLRRWDRSATVYRRH